MNQPKKPRVRPKVLLTGALSFLLLATVGALLAIHDYGSAVVLVIVGITGFLFDRRSSRRVRSVTRSLEKARKQLSDETAEVRRLQSRHEWIQEQLLYAVSDRLAISPPSIRHTVSASNPRSTLFISSNGAGMGHLARLLAIAEAMDGDRHFFTFSRAYRACIDRGFPTTYMPSHEAAQVDRRTWGTIAYSRLLQCMDSTLPSVVVFDGTYVYPEVTAACQSSGVPLVWIQRGSWRVEVDKQSRQRHNSRSVASEVIVPGDYGVDEVVDIGGGQIGKPTPPISLTQKRDLMTRDTAIETLGLPPGKRHVLIQLGSGVLDDIEDPELVAVEAVRSLGDGWNPVVAVSRLRATRPQLSGVTTITQFPLATTFRAFEFGILAAGYNATQESVGLNLPAVLIPNLSTRTDDQHRRAQGIQERGLGLMASTAQDLPEAVSSLADEVARNTVSAKQDLQAPPDGAILAAKLIEETRLRYASLSDDSKTG